MEKHLKPIEKTETENVNLVTRKYHLYDQVMMQAGH